MADAYLDLGSIAPVAYWILEPAPPDQTSKILLSLPVADAVIHTDAL